MARVGLAGAAQMVGQCCTASEAVQRVEYPQALAGVGGDVDHPNGLPGARMLARLGDLVREAQLAGAEEQDAPSGDLAGCASPGGAVLPGTVTQHVAHGVDRTGVRLAHLIEEVERVTGAGYGGLGRVVRGAPAPEWAAPGRASRMQD